MVTEIAALILVLMSAAPNRALYKDAGRREEMAQYFVEAGEEYDLPPSLLVVWAFGESSLKTTAKGELGEIGIFQVHGRAKQTCRQAGVDLESARGQIRCGALLIDMSRRYCGSLRGVKSIRRGLYRYASGQCNGTPRAIRITRRRLRQWNRLTSR
jgi:hypothetical protein